MRYQATKQQVFVNNHKNNDPEYIKLRETIEKEILRILSDNRALLKLAVLSIAESIRNNPDKYGYLVSNHNNNFYPPPPLTTTIYDSSTNSSCQPWKVKEQLEQQPQEQQYVPQNNYFEMLMDEADRLYTFLAERFLCDIVN